MGRPSEVVPLDDHVWLRRRGHTRIVDDDDWGFVGNDKDQGLLFYLLRVRHRLGADIRLTPCARDSSRPTFYYHYGSVGGTKPDALLQRWLQYAAKKQCDRAPLVPHLADNGFVLRRTIGWARRTRTEVRALREAMRETRRKAPPSDADAPLELCATALDKGLKCVAESGALRAMAVSLPDADCYTNTSCAIRTVAARQLLAAVDDDRVFTRPSPLLSPPQTTGRWAPYAKVPRHPAPRRGTASTAPLRKKPGTGQS